MNVKYKNAFKNKRILVCVFLRYVRLVLCKFQLQTDVKNVKKWA